MVKKKKISGTQLDVLEDKIYPNIDITTELENSYLDYAMSVIVSRALPDIRDGLKPVHRRILYSMYEAGYHHNKPYKKSARIVGDVMGKYHPHGDSSIYEAMVRMAQDFTMRLPLIDGQGNYGSMDGDPAAAMRYTEARLGKVTSYMLEELEFDTVPTRPNYDETLQEPKVLPSKFPNIFVNGASGIAVGMATNIPPHNLGEIIDATLKLVDEPDTTSKQLHKIVKGPDFPTGGIISGTAGLLSMYETGRGSVTVMSKLHDEQIRNKNAIVITEIPYLQNKSKLLERIAEVVNSKVIEGVSDIRDESNKEGVRIVIELKSSAMDEVVKNQLFQYTPLKTSFSSNMLALNETRPVVLNLHDGLTYFIEFRKEVITKRTVFKLNKARDKANLLIGLSIAVNSIDEVIDLIKKSKNNFINIGTKSGAMKPSSGYAMSFIQKQISDLFKNKSLINKKFANPHKLVDLWMDKIFLKVIASNPALAICIFTNLGKTLNGNEFALFMSGQANTLIRLKVILKMPKKHFLKALFTI